MDRRSFLKQGIGAIALAGLSQSETMAANSLSVSDEVKFNVTCENAKAGKDDLNVLFLGTGAAGWKPGGKSRRNSSVLLDNKVLIDWTLSVEDMLPKDAQPEALFYTHSHGDHYQPARAVLLNLKRVYVSETWIERATEQFKKETAKAGRPMPQIIPLKLAKPVEEFGLKITPIPANHATNDYNEQALIYLIEKGTTDEKLGVRLLYATDTGGIMGRASRVAGIDTHKSEWTPRPLTAFVMEATMGMNHDEDFRIFNHSSAALVSRTVNMLIETQRYTPPVGQPAYLTHMSRGLHDNLSQDELNAQLPNPLRAAYDGLKVVFKAMN